MLRPFVFILPSLLIGCVAGIFVGRTMAKPEGKPVGQSRPGTSVPQEGSSGSQSEVTCHIDYDRLATACARGAGNGALGVTGSMRSSTRSEDEAQGALTSIEEQATEEGVWTQLYGFKSQALLRKVPTDEARAFEERIAEKIRTGVLEPQAGAWLPAEQQREK